MAKNKGKHKSERVEEKTAEALGGVPETDAFVSAANRAVITAQDHSRKLVILGIALVGVLVAVALWNRHESNKREAVTSDYQKVVNAMNGEVGETPIDPDKEIFPTATARNQAALKALTDLKRDHAGSDVVMHAQLVEAKTQFELGKFSEARKVYSDYLRTANHPFLRSVAQEGLIYAMEAEATQGEGGGDLKPVMSKIDEMTPKEDGPERDRFLYHKARILDAMGKKDEARKLLSEMVEKRPNSPVAADAERRLALMEG